MPATSIGVGPAGEAAVDGGAMPNAASLRRPSGAIQSVVHAGASCVTTRASAKPAAASASTIAAWMTSVAGQPEYVGVTATTSVPASKRTSRTMPSSTMDTGGISGSGTVPSALQ